MAEHSQLEFEIVASRADEPARPGPRHRETDSEVETTLRSVQELLMRFPMATQAAFNALVAEGRNYAQTADGALLLQQLTHSKKANRARLVWEILTLSGITEQRTQAIPSLFLDKLARTVVVERLGPLLARLFDRKL